MKHHGRRLLGLGCVVLGLVTVDFACSVYTDDLLLPAEGSGGAGGGTGGAGLVGGAGGAAGASSGAGSGVGTGTGSGVGTGTGTGTGSGSGTGSGEGGQGGAGGATGGAGGAEGGASGAAGSGGGGLVGGGGMGGAGGAGGATGGMGGAGGGGGSSPQCGNGWVEGTEDCDGDGAGVPGETASCDADCTFVVCGDDVQNVTAGEQCDDGNPDSYDGCSAACRIPVSHLLLSEVMVGPSEAEFIEIYNPTGSAVSLDSIYLADYSTYYGITEGTSSPGAYDFRVRFPSGHTIAAGGFIVVAVQSATEYQSVHGGFPDFDLAPGDLNAPHMEGTIGGNTGLTNTGEMVVLFSWDGVSDLVSDFDYVTYGNAGDRMDKTGVTVGSETYLSETAVGSQIAASAPADDKSLHRCHTSELTETMTGGNGILGHDETSENMAAAWRVADVPTPGAAPATGFCPAP